MASEQPSLLVLTQWPSEPDDKAQHNKARVTFVEKVDIKGSELLSTTQTPHNKSPEYQQSRRSSGPANLQPEFCTNVSSARLGKSLRDQIWTALESTRSKHDLNKGFLSESLLDQILNEKSVEEELVRSYGKDGRTSTQALRKLFKGSRKKEAQEICRRLRRILATLLLISRSDAITDFLEEGLSDDDLPFKKVVDVKGDTISLTPYREDAHGSERVVKLFRNSKEPWYKREMDELAEHQWAVLVEAFPKNVKLDPVFPSSRRLPVIFLSSLYKGVHGEVLKARIPSEYHAFDDLDEEEDIVIHNMNRGKNELFAVKRIPAHNQDSCPEVRMLKRMRHPHIVTLFAAYEHSSHYHMILPLAKCNLAVYWRSENPTPVQNAATLFWMANQCEGIAEGLAELHAHKTRTGSSLFKSSQVSITSPLAFQRDPHFPPPVERAPRHQFYGRHGDIKPMNLLWFPGSCNDPGDMGIIKISDFGEGDFSTTKSTMCETRALSYTPCYRPPECDHPEEFTKISNVTYDTWSLGCLFLEFVTWFMGGWKLLFEFEQLRDGAFFTKTRLNADPRVKPTVSKHFADLTQKLELLDMEKCSDFLKNFLRLIEFHMLVVEPHGGPGDRARYNSHQIYNELGKMIEDSDMGKVMLVLKQIRKRVSRSTDRRVVFKLLEDHSLAG